SYLSTDHGYAQTGSSRRHGARHEKRLSISYGDRFSNSMKCRPVQRAFTGLTGRSYEPEAVVVSAPVPIAAPEPVVSEPAPAPTRRPLAGLASLVRRAPRDPITGKLLEPNAESGEAQARAFLGVAPPTPSHTAPVLSPKFPSMLR